MFNEKGKCVKIIKGFKLSFQISYPKTKNGGTVR